MKKTTENTTNNRTGAINRASTVAPGQKQNVPALRFPEFEGEWVEKKLATISKLITKGTTPQTFSEAGVNYVKIECLNGINIIKERCLYISEQTHFKELKRSILENDDILFAIAGATVGKIGIVTEDILPANTNQALAIIRLENKKLNTFLISILSSRRMKKYIFQSISVGAQPNLSLKQINDFTFAAPIQLPEQEKIASFLTAVDARIQLLQAKKEKLEEYKKGVMQQIFSQQLRFKIENKDGELVEPPDWEEKKLGEVCEKAQSGGTPKSTKKEFYNGSIPFLSISDMTTQGKYLTKTSKKISIAGLENSSAWLVPEKSLIYSMYASVGFVSINNIPLATSQAVMNIIFMENINLEYVYYYLLNFQVNIYRYIETGTQGNINAQIVRNIPIYLPCKAEQQKIASFLSALDEQIEKVEKQVENSKKFKQGLLQKMFV